MKILALETSTIQASVAVVVDGAVVSYESTQRQRSHSEVGNVFVETCLKQAGLKLEQIDVFATGQGPGSFTGIRVAANIAKTFCYTYNKPLVTVDSLSILAQQLNKHDKPILSLINAYKNMTYTGLLQTSEEGLPVFIKGPDAYSVIDLPNEIQTNAYVVGDGYLDYQEYFKPEFNSTLIRLDAADDYPGARMLGILAHRKVLLGQTLDWKSFLPLYIRASEAEESKRGILIKPLV